MIKYKSKRAVCVMCWFGDKLMLCKRRDKVDYWKGYWANVGGSVELLDDSLAHAAQREMQEETGFYINRSELEIIDCYQEGDFKCFIFQAKILAHLFNSIKNTEPEKHTDWALFTIQEVLKLRKLMPSIRHHLENLSLTKHPISR